MPQAGQLTGVLPVFPPFASVCFFGLLSTDFAQELIVPTVTATIIVLRSVLETFIFLIIKDECLNTTSVINHTVIIQTLLLFRYVLVL